jgi:26S proteasome regulatory subunit T1
MPKEEKIDTKSV